MRSALWRPNPPCHQVLLAVQSIKAVEVAKMLTNVWHGCAQVGIGLECGVGCDGFTEWKEGDIIDAFMVKEKRRTLEEASIMGSLDADDV